MNNRAKWKSAEKAGEEIKPVVPENSIRPDSRIEAESEAHQAQGQATQGRDLSTLAPLWALRALKSRRRLEAEILFLRHQLDIALRRRPARLRLRGSDRALLVWMTRLWPSLLGMARVVEPATILRWHRAGFRRYWRWKSRKRAGRPRIDRDLRDLIRTMSWENPLWGAPRIHGELLKLGSSSPS